MTADSESFIDEGVLAELSAASIDFANGTLVILPKTVDDAGYGFYPEDDQQLVKFLSNSGVTATFLQPSEKRRVLTEYSSKEALIGFALGVSQNMTWDMAKLATATIWEDVRRRVPAGDASVRVSVARVERPDGMILENVEILGPANDRTAERLIAVLCGDESALGEG